MRTVTFLCIALPAAALLGCTESAKQPAPSKPERPAPAAEVGDTVSVHYTGKLLDGTVFDTSLKPRRPGQSVEPLTFHVGAGEMIPGFDRGVRGMRVGERKTLRLAPEDAYGGATIRHAVAKSDLGPEVDKFKVGDKLPLRLRDGGWAYPPIVSIGERTITVEVPNPSPLAGKTLIFDVEMVEIRKQAG